MSSSLLITLEMTGVLGAVLVFGFYELWSLRRDKARNKAHEAQQVEREKQKDQISKK